MKKTYLATAVAALFASPITTAIAADTLLDDVVVSSSRSEQRSFDAPGSIQSVNRSQIENSGPQINLSESLSGIPGINVANRNNYSQDLQVSIRGYGARAPFGVRGVKMYQDGLPMTLADGQGQTSQFALTSADRIEVLKGPIASLYGNASGGVLQVFTRAPGDRPELIIADTFGSYGLNHKNIQYSEKKGNVGIVVDSSNFKSNGFRQWSATEREHLNAKLDLETEHGKASFIVNYLDNKKAQEPGSLTLSNYQSNPTYVDQENINQQLGKAYTQSIYGLVFDGKIDANTSYGYRVYGGDRKLTALTSSSVTGYSILDRSFMGGAISLTSKTHILDIPVRLIFGADYDYMKDYRLSYGNNSGQSNSTLKRDEDNLASNYGGFIQTEWLLSEKYSALAGIRYTQVNLKVKDRFETNTADASGSKTYSGASPILGLTYHLDASTNIYAQIGRGFESPTLNEVLYINTGTGSGGTNYSNTFDYGVLASKSNQVEIGFKSRPHNRLKVDGALFYSKTSNDLVPMYTRTVGSTWTNADTEKYGLEVSSAYITPLNFSLSSALTLISGKYLESSYWESNKIASSGNKIPGIPEAQFYLDAAWRSVDWFSKPKISYTEIGIDYRYVGNIYVSSKDDSNSVQTAAYNLFGARVSHHIKRGAHSLSMFGRVDNLFDRKYVSSIIVNQADSKYYEPGMPRNWILGVKYSLAMN